MEKKHPLTGLNFGAAYFAAAEVFLKESDEKEYCMIAIDIEHFGLFNQIHGEEEGDRLLLVISTLLKEYEQEHASVIGYLGGDNFSMVTEYDKDALRILRHKIREEIRVQNKTAGFPPAYGIYVITDKNEPVEEMYNHATVALSYVIGNYASRSCEYKREMDGKEEEEIRLLSEIREGIKRDEFTFFIQPQVDINQFKIVGGESLVRWIHGEKGMISPGVFIPVMETHGFIADLDMIVWDKACQWLRSCIDRGYKPVSISVNVSRIDIFSLDVPGYIISLVEKYDISPELLKIEITESAYAEEGNAIIEAVNRLRDYGFIVMMDDFGSGYSSLNMLKSVPVDVLKMDMRFLEINESEEEKGVGILESVINMARQMRIPIVVEGVENIVQESLLRKMGCSYTQGFYYYRPMSIDAFEEILSDDERLDHSGFWYRQAESVRLREFMDTNLFNDTVINNILGPAVFYEMVGKKIEITRVNNQYFELMGVSRQEEEEDYQKRFWNSVRDDDRPNLYAIFEEAYAKQKEGASGFINLVRRDGLTLWVNIRVYFLREKDEHRMFYASLTDMTAKKAETKVPVPIVQDVSEFNEEQIAELECYYGDLPVPFGIFKPYINSQGRPYYFQIMFANTKMSQIGGGDMQRLGYLLQCLFQEKQEDFLNAMCAAAYDAVESEDYIYSEVSNRYYDLKWYQYKQGYACCMMEDATHSHIYETVSGNIMQSFRAVYFLHLKDNYCRMIYPYAEDILQRGNFDEMVSRGFESGKILPYDEEGVRRFLSLENIRKELRKKDSIEYKYKRSVFPAGEEWCVTTITISERENGIPKTATMTIRSIEALMREKESDSRVNMARMLETMSDGFFIYHADGEEEMVYVNPPVLHLFGCKTIMEFKELTGYTFKGFVHPEDIKRVEWEIQSQIEETDRNMDYIRYRIIRKDGEVRWIDDVGHLETSEYINGPKLFYVFVSDITDSISEAEQNMLIAASKRFNESKE